MTITINPNLNYTNKIAFREGENKSLIDNNVSNDALSKTATTEKPVVSSVDNKSVKPRGFLSKVAYAWVNATEGVKGLLKGLFYGFLTGTVVAGIATVKNGIKIFNTKPRPEGFNLLSILNPKKSLGKSGRRWSWAAAGVVAAAHLVIAKLKANKRTANVDHMLYDGHRK